MYYYTDFSESVPGIAHTLPVVWTVVAAKKLQGFVKLPLPGRASNNVVEPGRPRPEHPRCHNEPVLERSRWWRWWRKWRARSEPRGYLSLWCFCVLTSPLYSDFM